jgi:methylmalonyl-CoA mutase C-terminal domain/subunit
MTLMKEKGMDDVLLTGGGIIPDADMKKLNETGVGTLFPPGTDTRTIVDYISAEVGRKRGF